VAALVVVVGIVWSAAFIEKHENFISTFLSIQMLSMLILALYLKWWLHGFYKLIERVYEKASFIEARLDAQAPAPSDILRHLTEWFQIFDSKRGGSEIFKEHLWKLKSSLMSAPWAKHYTAPQMAAEWNFFVATAIEMAKQGVFYERSLSQEPNLKHEATNEMILLNVQRLELAKVFDNCMAEDQLSPDSFAKHYYSQIKSRSNSFKRRESDRYFELSRMPQAPYCLPDWVN
jgi:hypothetical protein